MVKHQPPSKKRYDQRHPVVSFRVSKETYDQFKDLLEKEKKSIGQFFREALEVEERNYKEARRRGYKAAKEKYAVYAWCSSCLNGMPITDDDMKDEAGLLYSNEFTLLHDDCRLPEDMDPELVRRFTTSRQSSHE